MPLPFLLALACVFSALGVLDVEPLFLLEFFPAWLWGFEVDGVCDVVLNFDASFGLPLLCFISCWRATPTAALKVE